jgi:hypothetical protein
MPNIVFRDAQKTALRFLIKPNTPFQRILDYFADLRYPGAGIADEQINFAILELVSNSMRAHQERKTDKSVLVEFRCKGDALLVAIQDAGGGFDPVSLPYSLDEPVSALDLMSPPPSYPTESATTTIDSGWASSRYAKYFPDSSSPSSTAR